MDDEMLIEAVRQYQELYDITHKTYSDNIRKDNIWRKIGSELKTTGINLLTRQTAAFRLISHKNPRF